MDTIDARQHGVCKPLLPAISYNIIGSGPCTSAVP